MPITQTLNPYYDSNTDKDKFELEFAFTSASDGSASASTDDGTYMTKVITRILKGKILAMTKVIPGSATPSNLFDVTVKDEDGIDLFGGTLANLSSSAATVKYPYDGNTNYGTRLITGAITVAVTNAGDTKTGTIILHFE